MLSTENLLRIERDFEVSTTDRHLTAAGDAARYHVCARTANGYPGIVRFISLPPPLEQQVVQELLHVLDLAPFLNQPFYLGYPTYRLSLEIYKYDK